MPTTFASSTKLLLGFATPFISSQTACRSLGMPQDLDEALEPPTTPIDAPCATLDTSFPNEEYTKLRTTSSSRSSHTRITPPVAGTSPSWTLQSGVLTADDFTIPTRTSEISIERRVKRTSDELSDTRLRGQPLRYKFSWSLCGGLLALLNSASFLANGAVTHVAGADLMASAQLCAIASFVPVLEESPNRNSMPFRAFYRIPEAHPVVRGALQYVGFAAIHGGAGEDRLARGGHKGVGWSGARCIFPYRVISQASTARSSSTRIQTPRDRSSSACVRTADGRWCIQHAVALHIPIYLSWE
ncbi:hypothetical protein B0H14DRAFT_3147250 [Mycena olivaceomarginata]|nr:hypothetical protein B0H14DRAFT_3147250 [Mycena olivaceomarginata]